MTEIRNAKQETKKVNEKLLKPSVHLSNISSQMNNAIKSEKVFTLIALYYRKKKTEIKGKPFPNRITLLLYKCISET